MNPFDMSTFGGSGPNSRFGSAAPFSMFNNRTVRPGGVGDYTVHPMIPNGGGPMPMQQGQMGTTAADRMAGENFWAASHQSPSDSAIATRMPNGMMQVRGNPLGQGRSQYMPAGQVAGLYSRMAGMPGMNLPPLSVVDGVVKDHNGNVLDDAGMAQLMVQARTAAMGNKRSAMRDSMQRRLAVRAAQRRGDLGPMMAANGGNWFAPPGMAAAVTPRWGNGPFGPGRAVAGFPAPMNMGDDGGGEVNPAFGMAAGMLGDASSGLTPVQRANYVAKLTKLRSTPNGHLLIPGLIEEIGRDTSKQSWNAAKSKEAQQKQMATNNRIGRQSLGGMFAGVAPDFLKTMGMGVDAGAGLLRQGKFSDILRLMGTGAGMNP